jgi:hypothetical protein
MRQKWTEAAGDFTGAVANDEPARGQGQYSHRLNLATLRTKSGWFFISDNLLFLSRKTGAYNV